MNRFAIATLLAASAVGAQAQTFIDQARVRSVDPQYENVGVPRNECTSQWINETRRVGGGDYHGGSGYGQGGGVSAGNYGGAVIGGVAGAILGNQVGKGSGRAAATAVGAVVGAFAGDRIGNSGQYQPQYQAQYQPQYQAQYQDAPREVTRCRTVSDVQTRITGYRVNYEYRGQAYSTLMRENPGSQVAVRVTVEPVERY